MLFTYANMHMHIHQVKKNKDRHCLKAQYKKKVEEKQTIVISRTFLITSRGKKKNHLTNKKFSKNGSKQNPGIQNQVIQKV